jgi:signal transduction histidine kinase
MRLGLVMNESTVMFFRFPKIVAAQRLQIYLLLAALVAVVLGWLLFSDLVRTFRSTVVADADKSLANAVRELAEAQNTWVGKQTTPPKAWALTQLDQTLRAVSYAVLVSYPDVEGGYLRGDEVVGQSFPTYTEPGSELKQPAIERRQVLAALGESRRTGHVARREVTDGRDLVVVAVFASPTMPLPAWSLKRYINFYDPNQARHGWLLAGLLAISLVSIGAVLRLSFGLQRGFAAIQAGLSRLRTDVDYRLIDQNHELRPIVRAINDMAESRQKLEADLRREDRLRVMGRIVAGIAHEVRNPLNSIRITIQVLERRLRKQDIAEESFRMVLAEVDRLDGLLQSLLVFRSEESGRVHRQALRPVLERTLALVRPQVRDRGIAAELVAPEDIEACVDADRLHQAVMNLLLNAIDAAGDGGQVAIRVEKADSQAIISVRDSGPGLTAEQREHLFEAFYTTKARGTGLGLAVTRTLLERMGGTVQYVTGDMGAHFRILLPAGGALEA